MRAVDSVLLAGSGMAGDLASEVVELPRSRSTTGGDVFSEEVPVHARLSSQTSGWHHH